MSELTLFLIRLAYLAILWIFVLSALSVIRSDMFGARMPEGARNAAAKRDQRPPKPAKARRGAPTHVLVVDGENQGERADLAEAPILIGRGPDAAIRLDDDYVSTRHARIAASGDQWFVEDLGLHQRHLHRQRPDHPADHAHARHAGARRQDRDRAEEVADDVPPALRRDLRRRPGPQGQPGLRVRRPVDARGLRRRRRRGARRPGVGHRDRPAAQARRQAQRRHARPGGRRPAPRQRPDRRARRRRPDPERHEHDRDDGAVRRREAHVRSRRRQPGVPVPRGRAPPGHQGPHVRAEPDRRGPDHRARRRAPTRTAT